MRHCQLRIDRITGADWPPLDHEAYGKKLTLSALFEPALALDLSFGTEDLGRFGRVCTPGVLQHWLDDCPDCQHNGWHTHLFIVDQIEQAGWRPLGLMFDQDGARRSDGSGSRRGCAISWRVINGLRRQYSLEVVKWLYLRAVAHELGHVFNLGHDERPSLMTPQAWFAQRQDFPKNLSFDLWSAQINWLQSGPEAEVRPGGAPFHGRGGLG